MQITIPHKFRPRSYQLPLLKAIDSGCERAVVVWNRRSGKDKVCFNLVIKKAFERIGTYYYFLPTFSLAKKVIWDNIDNDGFKMLDHIPKQAIKATNATELKIELVNGSIIQLIAANEFSKGGVGTNPVGVVFSEYSISASDVWDYVRPILASNGGWAIFNFTPRGRNHAYNILQQAKEFGWFSEILTVDQTQSVNDIILEKERAQMPHDLFRQEYYCEFLEDAGGVFRGVDDVLVDRMPEYHREKHYQMGVDLAKYQDFTVITPFDLHAFTALKPERFNQIDYNLQKAKIEAYYYHYNKAKTRMDSTGVGDPVIDDLNQRGLKNIEPYLFTERSRRDLLTNLQLVIEQRIIKIYNDEVLVNELKSCQYELGERGKVKMVVPEGLHDDCMMSLALATWDLPAQPLKLITQQMREDVRMFDANRAKINKRYSLNKYAR